MLPEHLSLIVCPVCSDKPTLKVIATLEKVYEGVSSGEIMEGILFSACGFLFPIVDGVPRLHVEAMFDFQDFLSGNLADFGQRKEQVLTQHKKLIEYCIKKNTRSKASFAMEWSFLKPEKNDKLWADELSALPSVFLAESGFDGKTARRLEVLDAGCGHGLTTNVIAHLCSAVVGMELSRAVDAAYNRNRCRNAFFLQGDVQFPPFANNVFDLVYSSGVIHHTNNMPATLKTLLDKTRHRGRICLWLYHPQDKPLHHLSLYIRKFFSKLPLKVAAVMICVFIFPVSFLLKKLKGHKHLNYREEMINLFDSFTPEFREEIPQESAIQLLTENGCENVQITTTSQFGFSITGDRL
jgi:SAM-dependent methyltransferase/uncharacterized protein YbaR (Trm112 family)